MFIPILQKASQFLLQMHIVTFQSRMFEFFLSIRILFGFISALFKGDYCQVKKGSSVILLSKVKIFF